MADDGTTRGSVYQLTEVQRSAEGQEIELKRIISAREYAAFSKSRDVSRHIVRQRRISFLYRLQSLAVHIYEGPSPGLCILHAQVESTGGGDGGAAAAAAAAAPPVDLPDFLDVERRLEGEADERLYGSYALSLVSKDTFDDT